MPRHIVAVAAIAVLLGGLAPAQARIVVTVDKTTQRLLVVVDGAPRYQWPVSTARRGYRTPNGTYRPQVAGAQCIRLHPQNAALLFALVKERVGDTTIVVTGGLPERAVRSRAALRAHTAPTRARRNFEDTFNAAPDAAEAERARRRWENLQ